MAAAGAMAAGAMVMAPAAALVAGLSGFVSNGKIGGDSTDGPDVGLGLMELKQLMQASFCTAGPHSKLKILIRSKSLVDNFGQPCEVCFW